MGDDDTKEIIANPTFSCGGTKIAFGQGDNVKVYGVSPSRKLGIQKYLRFFLNW